MKFEKYRRLTLRGFVILALAAALVAGTCVTSGAIEIEIDVSGGNGGNGGNIEIGIDPALKPKPQPPASSSSSKPEAPSSKPAAPSSKPAAPSSKPETTSSIPEVPSSESSASSEGANENQPAPTKLGEIGAIEVYSDTGLFLPLLKTLQLDLLSDTVYPADRLQKLFSK